MDHDKSPLVKFAGDAIPLTPISTNRANFSASFWSPRGREAVNVPEQPFDGIAEIKAFSLAAKATNVAQSAEEMWTSIKVASKGSPLVSMLSDDSGEGVWGLISDFGQEIVQSLKTIAEDSKDSKKQVVMLLAARKEMQTQLALLVQENEALRSIQAQNASLSHSTLSRAERRDRYPVTGGDALQEGSGNDPLFTKVAQQLDGSPNSTFSKPKAIDFSSVSSSPEVLKPKEVEATRFEIVSSANIESIDQSSRGEGGSSARLADNDEAQELSPDFKEISKLLSEIKSFPADMASLCLSYGRKFSDSSPFLKDMILKINEFKELNEQLEAAFLACKSSLSSQKLGTGIGTVDTLRSFIRFDNKHFVEDEDVLLVDQLQEKHASEMKALVNYIHLLHGHVSAVHSCLAEKVQSIFAALQKADSSPAFEEDSQFPPGSACRFHKEFLDKKAAMIESIMERVVASVSEKLADANHLESRIMDEGCDQSSDEVEALSSRLMSAEEEKIAAQATAAGMTAKANRLEEDLQLVQNRISELEAGLTADLAAGSRTAELEEENEQLMAGLLAMGEENEALKRSLECKEAEAVKLNKILVDLEENLSNRVVQSEKMESELKTVQDRLFKAELKLKRQLSEADKIKSEAEASLRALDSEFSRCQELTEEIKMLNEKVVVAGKTSQFNVQNLLGRIAGLEGKNRELEAVLSQKQGLEAEWQRQLSGLKQEAVLKSAEIERLTEKLEAMNERISPLEADNAALKKTADVLHRNAKTLSENVQKANNEVERLGDDLEFCFHVLKRFRDRCRVNSSILHLLPGMLDLACDVEDVFKAQVGSDKSLLALLKDVKLSRAKARLR